MTDKPRNEREASSGIRRRRFLGVAAGSAGLIVALPLLTACGAAQPTPTTAPEATKPAGAAPAPTTAPAAGQPKRGGVLRIANAGAAEFLDPAKTLTIEDTNATGSMYNYLTRVDAALKVHPDLATSWEPSDDLKTWTFKLRDGVKFHHGKTFNADDVAFTFTRILDKETASPYRAILSFIEKVEKKEDLVAVFHLKQAYADLPTVLGGYHSCIVPSDRTAEQIAKEPSGTGPFKFKEISPGDHITMVRNENYWEPGLPYLDEIRYVTLPEQAGRVAALSGGQIDVISQVEPEAMSIVEADPNSKLLQVRSGGYVPLVMRTDMPPFDDNRVRLAMKLVVDREQMRDVVLYGKGDLGNDQPIPPVLPVYSDVGVRKRDVEKAKELLKEAGHADGLKVTLYASPGRPGMVEQAIAYKEMAAPAGIQVEIQQIPIDAFWADYWMKKEFSFSNWNFATTADEMLASTFMSDSEWNEAFWKSPKMDDLIGQARGEKDEAKRKALYAEAQKLISDEGGHIIAFHKPFVMAVGNKVRDLEAHPAAWIRPRAYWLDS